MRLRYATIIDANIQLSKGVDISNFVSTPEEIKIMQVK
jgi:hypothetical protein